MNHNYGETALDDDLIVQCGLFFTNGEYCFTQALLLREGRLYIDPV